MRIVEKNHRFVRSPLQRQTTNSIVIHHSASADVSSETIHQWHLNRGWIGIGYHFVIRSNGTIERGRPIGTVGTHALSPANETTVGICLTGNFEQNPPRKEQLDSLRWLILSVIHPQYGKIPIGQHKDWARTACPGRLFPMESFMASLTAQEEEEVYHLIINNQPVIGIPKLLEGGVSYVQLMGRNRQPTWVAMGDITRLLGGTISWDGPKKTVTVRVPGPSADNLPRDMRK